MMLDAVYFSLGARLHGQTAAKHENFVYAPHVAHHADGDGSIKAVFQQQQQPYGLTSHRPFDHNPAVTASAQFQGV